MSQPISELYGGIRNVESDDVVSGCVKWLSLKEDLTDLVGHELGTPPHKPFIFQDELYATLEGTQTSAVVVSHAGTWGGGVGHRTSAPRIQVSFYADPLRNVSGHAVNPSEARRRLFYIYERFDFYLHRPGALRAPDGSWGRETVEWWGNLRTTSCLRLGDMSLAPAVPDGDGMLRGDVYYGVVVG